MENIIWLVAIAAAVNLLLLGWVVYRVHSPAPAINEDRLRDEFRINRHETADQARQLREEISTAQQTASDAAIKTITEIGRSQQTGFGAAEKRIQSLVDSNDKRLNQLRDTIGTQMQTMRSGNESAIEKMQNAITTTINDMKKSQQQELKAVEGRMKSLAEQNDSRMEKLRETVNKQMQSLQENNEKKLDQMRQTVDEKLHNTLEKRLGESFKLVSERLEAVQRGLGDMQHLATGVGDLKRMLTNVKTRGTWGEFQVGDILEQILTPEQYQKNVRVRETSAEIVEYAIRLPGKGDGSTPCWLPIDSKFPQEDYQRLLDAAEKADAAAVEESTRALIRSLQKSAKDIAGKYIEPPATTDFALMFLPTEGLYSEALRQPGMVEKLQREYRVIVAGPTTLAAILNSLRMGFRTLAIEERSSEVWRLLATVRTEFQKFGETLAKVKKQLDTAAKSIDSTQVRTRAMDKALKAVEVLPSDQSNQLLGEDGDRKAIEGSG